MQYVDLHTHSTKSDGSYTPTELVTYASVKGLRAVALTDHDSVDGLDEALACGRQLQQDGTCIEVVPGIEFSTKYENKDIHLVGLYIDHKSPKFEKPLQEFIASRDKRNETMCALLREHGLEITPEILKEKYPDSVITRAHYAAYMLETGFVKSRAEAFERYVGDDCCCFIPREKITPEQAIELVLAAGGIPILAHPTLYHLSFGKLSALTGQLKEAGLMGIETRYPTYNSRDRREMDEIAKAYGLLSSGGSDFHGANKPGLDLACGYGNLQVPVSFWEKIVEAAGK